MTVAGATRSERVIDLLAARELDSLLVTNLINVRYVTGFTGTNGACLVGPGDGVGPDVPDEGGLAQAGKNLRRQNGCDQRRMSVGNARG